MKNALATIESNELSAGIYSALLEALQKIGPFEIEVKKMSIHVTHGRAFLGIHPRKSGLLVNIVMDSPLDSKRLRKQEQVSKNRYHNEILISDIPELDSEIVSAMKSAYQLTL